MNDDLKDRLIADFPAVFIENCNISCGDGWYELVCIVAEDVQRFQEKAPDVVITDIYSKLGTMRVLINGGGQAAGESIIYALKMSEKFCEQCGAPSRLHVYEGVYLSRCDTHFAEFKKEHDEWMHKYD